MKWAPFSSWVLMLGALVMCACGVNACGPGRHAGRRRSPRKLIPLVFKQHVPNTSEFAVQASSLAEGRITRHDPRFKDLTLNYNHDIIFKDEEGTGADRLMTQRCKEKLDTLAISVMNQWPGVRLRVTEGWDEQGHHAADSLHYEGRAVDITTSDRDRSKYGMLARLAVEAGFDWVYYESRAHIHCSVKSESSQAARYGGCFTSNSTVTTPSGPKRMSQLSIGENVLSVDSNGQLTYSPVIMFLDYNPNTTRTFMYIQTTHRHVNATAAHLFPIVPRDSFRNDTPIDITRTEYAERIQVGDYLMVRNGDKTAYERVESVESYSSRGVYAPLTETGTVVVNDVVASCFAVINSQTIAQVSFWPFRVYYNFRELIGDVEGLVRRSLGWKLQVVRERPQIGIHWYPSTMYSIAGYLPLGRFFR